MSGEERSKEGASRRPARGRTEDVERAEVLDELLGLGRAEDRGRDVGVFDAGASACRG
jgi:hypothetical protein